MLDKLSIVLVLVLVLVLVHVLVHVLVLVFFFYHFGLKNDGTRTGIVYKGKELTIY